MAPGALGFLEVMVGGSVAPSDVLGPSVLAPDGLELHASLS